MKKRTKISAVTILTAVASSIGLISLGFASWTINQSDEATVNGEIAADTMIAMTGFRVVSITTFDYGVYSYGSSSTFVSTGDITYTIGITPSLFDPDSIDQYKLNKKIVVFGRFNSLLEVFTFSNDDFEMFNGATWNNAPVTRTGFNNNNYFFKFEVTGLDDLEPGAEVTRELKFTFNNKLLVKKFPNNQTVENNKFTLSLGKEDFSA